MPTDRNLTKREISTYAEILLAAAESEDTVFTVGTQLKEATTVVRGSIDLRTALDDMTLEGETRSSIARDVFREMDPAIVSTLGVMAERGDISLLSRVCEMYSDLSEEVLGSVVVDVTTAVELDDALRKTIVLKLAADLGKDVLLSEHVDPSIIGGIVMSTHGKRIDASVVSQLENARVVLSTVPTGGER